MILISLLAQIHTSFAENSWKNRIKLYAEAAPVIGFSMISLNNPAVFTIVGGTNSLKSNDLSFGVKAGAGIEFSLSNYFGIFAEASAQKSFVNSPIHIENQFNMLNLSVGLKFNISKTKRFNY